MLGNVCLRAGGVQIVGEGVQEAGLDYMLFLRPFGLRVC